MKKSTGDDIYDIDWETAQMELQKEIEEVAKKQNAENEKRKQDEFNLLKKDLEEEYTKKKKEMEEELKSKLKNTNYNLKK